MARLDRQGTPQGGGVIRRRLLLRGFVQGVGFRPHVHNLACSLGLSGFVRNTGQGLEIEVQGPAAAVAGFSRALRDEGPEPATVLACEEEDIAPAEERGFVILASRQDGAAAMVMVPPDLAVCPACLAEMRDPGNRRYRHPFINCTACGPRYTILASLPYDRAATSMAAFTMCSACRREYEDPADRRFHAQPNCCPECGPGLVLTDPDGRPRAEGEEAVSLCVERLIRGGIVAVKGVGGFHLAASARDRRAVARLRQRKQRPAKPFALMARDLETVATVAVISAAARQALVSPRAPIVLLPRLAADAPCPEVAPGLAHLGVMLPYTPLHHLLFADNLDLLVMTSGNRSGEPIVTANHEAMEKLAGIADLFLFHDRDILTGCDDSVEIELGGALVPVRRSRGHVPRPVRLAASGPPVLGVGGNKKNTVCLLRGDLAFFSHHLGDLENAAVMDAFAAGVGRLEKLLGTRPGIVACDLHPDYLSSRWAAESGRKIVRVPHHHAHFAACLAENRVTGPAVGIVLDGAGLGPDGSIWGGEILAGTLAASERCGSLAPLRLAGGDTAVREPWRTAAAFVHQSGCAGMMPEAVSAAGDTETVRMALEARINAPMTTSCGRLFDAVSAMCGLCLFSSFDGEAPARLMAAADPGEDGAYPVKLEDDHGFVRIDTPGLVRAVAADLAAGAGPGRVSARFHRGLGRGLARAAAQVCRRQNTNTVALSGGVFVNPLLFAVIKAELAAAGFAVLHHRRVPPGDGGIALGQAVAARAARP